MLWDLDPQGAATFYFRQAQGIESSVRKVVSGKTDIGELVKHTAFENLSIIPSDLAMRNLDILLEETKKSKTRLRDILDEVKKDYSRVFLDCPPGISLLSENIFHAADHLIVPVIPTTLSERTLGQIRDFFEQKDLDKKHIAVFFSMAEKRKRLHRETMERLSGELKRVCAVSIPYSSEIEKMGLYGRPITAARPKSKAAAAYRALWDELKTLFGLS